MQKILWIPAATLALLSVTADLSAQNTVFTYQGRVTDNGTNFNGPGQFKFALVASAGSSNQATATAVLTGPFVTSYLVTYGGSGYTAAPAVTVTGGGGSGATAQAFISGGVVTNIAPISAGSGYASVPTVTVAPPSAGSYTTYWSNDGTGASGSEPVSAVAVTVNNGLFTVVLGDATVPGMTTIPISLFIQPNLRLQIWFNDGVNGSLALTPAQGLTPAPYAIMAATASNFSGTISAAQISGMVGNGQLASNSITLNAGSGLSGGGTVTLGGTTTLNNAGIVSISGNPDITATVSNGVVTLGSTAASTNVPGSIVKRDASGNFSAGSVALSGTLSLSLLPVSLSANGGALLLRADSANNFFTGLGAGNVLLSGMQNTALGNNALRADAGGGANSAMGFDSLYNNTSGNNNLAAGVNALFSNLSGSQNSASGFDALYLNTSGNNNTASGVNALYNNLNGFQNTASGYDALYNNSSGSNNTAVGAFALAGSSTGTNNIALGYQAGYNVTTGNNNIHIGNPGFSSDTNTLRLGTQGTQTSAFIAGIYGATVSGGVAAYVTPSGQLGVLSSSARFKEDIRDMRDASEVLLSLRPVAFRYKADIDPKGVQQFGLIAEEVARVDPELVARDGQNQIFTVRYEAVNAMLLNEFLKQHRAVEKQNAELQDLVRKVDAQKLENTQLKQRLAALEREMPGPKSK